MNKLSVVTGGTKGIGRAIIAKFASESFDIATCARTQTELEELKREIEALYPGIKVFIHRADLGDKNQVKLF